MAERERDQFARVVFYAVVVLMGYLGYLVVRPFLQPLGWAIVFALMFNPLQVTLTRRYGQSRAAFVNTVLAGLIIIGPAVTLLSVLAREVVELAASLQTEAALADLPLRLQAAWDTIRARSPMALPEDPAALLAEGVQRAASLVAPRAGSLLRDVFSTLFSLVVMLFALFFFLRDGPTLTTRLTELLPFTEPRRERLVAETRDLVIASVGAGLTVALAQGLIGGVAFWLLGLPAPVFWGVAMMFCGLVPVAGTAIVWLPTALWLLLSGSLARGVILIAVGAGVIGMTDNLLRPLLLSGRTTANGLVIFLGLLGGVVAFGFIGLVLGPIVLVTVGTLLDACADANRPARPPANSEK